MLTKPIVVFDLESTSADVATARIVQFAAIKIHSLAQTGNDPKEELQFLVNPGRPIPPEVTAIHGISDDMVKDQPMMNIAAAKIQEFMEGCDLCSFNGKRFDIPLLAEEFSRSGFTFSLKDLKVIDVFVLYKILHPQSLAAAHVTYTGEPLEGAHDAMNDVVGTFRVLQGMLSTQVVPADLAELVKFQNNGAEFDDTVDFAGKFKRRADGEIILNFGKHRGEPAKDHLDFVSWMQGKDFTRDTLDWCEELLARRYELPNDRDPDWV